MTLAEREFNWAVFSFTILFALSFALIGAGLALNADWWIAPLGCAAPLFGFFYWEVSENG